MVLSVAHPMVFRDAPLEQREKSWYMLLFQFEGVAEELLERDDWALLRTWLRGNGDVERYIADLSRPGALTAALNWYRASSHPRTRAWRAARPAAGPGAHDGHLEHRRRLPARGLMPASAEYVAGQFRYERIEGASHWMQLDAPDRLNELLVEFLT